MNTAIIFFIASCVLASSSGVLAASYVQVDSYTYTGSGNCGVGGASPGILQSTRYYRDQHCIPWGGGTYYSMQYKIVNSTIAYQCFYTDGGCASAEYRVAVGNNGCQNSVSLIRWPVLPAVTTWFYQTGSYNGVNQCTGTPTTNLILPLDTCYLQSIQSDQYRKISYTSTGLIRVCTYNDAACTSASPICSNYTPGQCTMNSMIVVLNSGGGGGGGGSGTLPSGTGAGGSSGGTLAPSSSARSSSGTTTSNPTPVFVLLIVSLRFLFKSL